MEEEKPSELVSPLWCVVEAFLLSSRILSLLFRGPYGYTAVFNEKIYVTIEKWSCFFISHIFKIPVS